MIDILTTDVSKLKKVTQIGTPGSEGKIYVRDTPYTRMHLDEFVERRVFVLMGHTEHTDGSYVTFVEEAIPVPDIAFEQDTPRWTNKVWNQVYQEIKISYDEMIVVGWAMDLKGKEPQITMELESIHREYFGGAHQIFFLLNTSNREEYFYINKNNHLYRKPGFYIYYTSEKKQIIHPSIYKGGREKKISGEKRKDSYERERRSGGRYREMLLSKENETEQMSSGRFPTTAAVFAAAVLLAAIAGTIISRNPDQMSKVEDMISALSSKVVGKEISLSSTQAETEASEDRETETADPSETAYTKVEKVDGKIPKGK